MVTMAENERLAVLESQYASLQTDVSEIKKDVKALVAVTADLQTALAVKNATDSRGEAARGTMGVWVRSMLPIVLMAAGLMLTLLNTLDLTIELVKH